MQFDIIMLDVAAPDPTADPGTLNSIPAQFLSTDFVVEGLRRRLRWESSLHLRCSVSGSREGTNPPIKPVGKGPAVLWAGGHYETTVCVIWLVLEANGGL